jgi:hypothetical protein
MADMGNGWEVPRITGRFLGFRTEWEVMSSPKLKQQESTSLPADGNWLKCIRCS